MSFLRTVIVSGLCVGLVSLLTPAHADTETGYLYVSDYGAQALDRFIYSYDTTTNTISNWLPAGSTDGSAVFINANVKEGLQGTRNDIIVVGTGGNSLERYSLAGVDIGTINILNPDNTSHSLNSVGNVAITKDGKYMYAPESSGNVIDKIDLATGKIVANISFNGAHDVLILPDGSILAAGYTGSEAGIYHIPADLSSKTLYIANGDNGLSRPTGMSLSSTGTLYIQSNVFPTGDVTSGANTVYKYSVDTGSSSYTPTFSSKTTSDSLQFDFGTDLGPDGNLYIAALGGGETHATFGSLTSYTNGVYQFDSSTSAVSLAVGGYNPGSGTPADGFESPKYLQFGFNFITADDPGAPASTPEPGTVALFSGLLTAGSAVMLKRRRRSA